MISIFLRGCEHACAKRLNLSFHILPAFCGAVASHARPEAEAAGAVCDQFGGQRAPQRKTSRGLSAHGTCGISLKRICPRFQAPEAADTRAQPEYFSRLYRITRNHPHTR